MQSVWATDNCNLSVLTGQGVSESNLRAINESLHNAWLNLTTPKTLAMIAILSIFPLPQPQISVGKEETLYTKVGS